MTPEEIERRLAEFQQALDASQQRIDYLETLIEQRQAFNNGIAFNLNKLRHEMERFMRSDGNEAKTTP